MKDKQAYESVCFEVISAAGTAKSFFLEAIESAKASEPYSEALDAGYDAFMNASRAHAKALSMDAAEELDMGLLLIHAETILCSAETIWNLAETIISLIEKTR